MIRDDLKKYIETFIFPENEKNDSGHNMGHIHYVIRRSLEFAEQVENINFDMVYTIAAYHDIAHHIDAKNHEIESGKFLYDDPHLREYFLESDILIMKEAIEDHRASLEGKPRSIYGKIISSADRNTDIVTPIKRTYSYRLQHGTENNLDEIIENSRLHLIQKYCQTGYATEKMYFEDPSYQKFLEDIDILCKDKELFYKMYIEINELK